MVKTSKQRIEGNSSIDKGYLQKRTINISNNKILKSFPLKSEERDANYHIYSTAKSYQHNKARKKE